ncbi:MAG: TetR/AcrR family transcriptional regulator [marine benthic group bacterium]|nr:TetR/AcrR family transcriptional regulator [Gemmatimonadota bacterium]
MAASKRRRTSKAEWFEAALEVLGKEGIDGVRVERLARDLGTSKSGFYWHFKDRRDLEMQLLEYWAHEYTEVVSENPELLLVEASRRIAYVAEMVMQHDLSGYDLAFFAWAERDREVAERVADVIERRLSYLNRAFAELGITGAEADFRKRLFVCYMAWEGKTYPGLSARKRRTLRERLVEWLTEPPLE